MHIGRNNTIYIEPPCIYHPTSTIIAIDPAEIEVLNRGKLPEHYWSNSNHFHFCIFSFTCANFTLLNQSMHISVFVLLPFF